MNETTASYVLGIPNSLQYIKKNFPVYVNIIKRKREEQKSKRKEQKSNQKEQKSNEKEWKSNLQNIKKWHRMAPQETHFEAPVSVQLPQLLRNHFW